MSEISPAGGEEGDSPRARLQAVEAQARSLLHRQRALHEALARSLRPEGPEEAELAELLEARRALVGELGQALLAVLAAELGEGEEVAEALEIDFTREPREAESVEEAPEPVKAPEPSGPPASPASVHHLAEHFQSPNWKEPPSAAELERARRSRCDAVGAPAMVLTQEGARSEVRRLHRAVGGLLDWREQPQELQKAWVGLLATRARHVQDESGIPLPPVEQQELDSVFSQLTRYSAQERPGFVVGLARHQEPVGETWLEDAWSWWRELVPEEREEDVLTQAQGLAELEQVIEDGQVGAPGVLEAQLRRLQGAGVAQSDPRLRAVLLPVAEEVVQIPGFKTLKNHLRRARRAEPEPHAEDGSVQTWRLRRLTEGRRVVIVGADPRETVRQRLQEAAGFAEVEWVDPDARTTAALVERIRSGRYDLVFLVTSYMKHKTGVPVSRACKESGVDTCWVHRGFGLQSFEQSFEHFCGEDEPEA